MAKRLLIAVDGTRASIAAVLRAIEMANRGEAELRLAHVADETKVRLGERDNATRRIAIDALAGAGDRILSEALAMIRGAGHDASCARLRRQRTADRIGDLLAAEAASWGADLILVGSLGHGPVRRALLGGVEAQLMRHASAPVLPVKSAESRAPRPQPAGTPGRLGLA